MIIKQATKYDILYQDSMPPLLEKIEFQWDTIFSKLLQNKSLRSSHNFSACPNRLSTWPLDKFFYRKQNFNEAMKGNQNLPNN